MGIRNYSLVNNSRVQHEVFEVKLPAPKVPEPLLSDAIQITLAQSDAAVSRVITAHNLQDYRRRKFTLHLLADIRLPLDDILRVEEKENELL